MEATVRILPLAPGELLLNGFYLLEENTRGGNRPPGPNRPRAACDVPHPHTDGAPPPAPPPPLPPQGVRKETKVPRSCRPVPIIITRRFAHALPVRVVYATAATANANAAASVDTNS